MGRERRPERPLRTYRLGLFIFFLCKYRFISDELYLCGNRFGEISLSSVPVFTSCDACQFCILFWNTDLLYPAVFLSFILSGYRSKYVSFADICKFRFVR